MHHPGNLTTEARAISEHDEPVIWLRGEKAGLGPFSGDLVERYWRMEQDPVVLVGYGNQVPTSLEARREGYEHQARGDDLRFTVFDVTAVPPAPVGTAAVLIDSNVRVGEFVIQLGERSSRGRGIGAEASRLVLDYAFHVTNLACVHLAVLEPNAGAIAAYEKAGFRRAGKRRNSGFWLGDRVDEVLMDAVPAEFPGPSLVKQMFN